MPWLVMCGWTAVGCSHRLAPCCVCVCVSCACCCGWACSGHTPCVARMHALFPQSSLAYGAWPGSLKCGLLQHPGTLLGFGAGLAKPSRCTTTAWVAGWVAWHGSRCAVTRLNVVAGRAVPQHTTPMPAGGGRVLMGLGLYAGQCVLDDTYRRWRQCLRTSNGRAVCQPSEGVCDRWK